MGKSRLEVISYSAVLGREDGMPIVGLHSHLCWCQLRFGLIQYLGHQCCQLFQW